MNKHVRPSTDAAELRGAAFGLRTEWIVDWPGFAPLKAEWQALHRSDPESGVFLSWAWLSDLFTRYPGQWRVLILRDGAGALVAALPLRHKVHWSRSMGQLQSQLAAAGRLGMSEYTGFLCEPEVEEHAIPALAQALSAQQWTRLSLRYEPTQTRSRRFAAALDATRFDVAWPDYTINGGETNQLLCPQVALPADSESYLSQALSANTRQKARRMMRKHLESGALQIVETSQDTFEDHAKRLLDNWYAKWSIASGKDRARKGRAKYASLLQRAQRLGLLHMPTLWDGPDILGALAHIVDQDSGVSHFMVAGRDMSARGVDVGLLLHLHAIRWSIENGLTRYDFGHGTEPYKYSYGAENKPVSYFVAERKSAFIRSALDPAALPEALKRVDGLVADGQSDAARAALQQLAALAKDWRNQPSSSSSP
ncbi:MAG: GNAT family N-acetyltransferase [Paracoccaceae bacterium]|nr:GNAT family N-acetyltransferase [Paracoccaceae bacterium]